MRLAVFLKAKAKAKSATKKIPYAASAEWDEDKAKTSANNTEMQEALVEWIDGGQKGGSFMGLQHAGWLTEDYKLTATGASAYYTLTGKSAKPKKPSSKPTGDSISESFGILYDKNGVMDKQISHDPKSPAMLKLESAGMVEWDTDEDSWSFTQKGQKAVTLWANKAGVGPESSQQSKPQLIQKKIWVHKNGKTFQQTFWIHPEDSFYSVKSHVGDMEANEESGAKPYMNLVDETGEFLSENTNATLAANLEIMMNNPGEQAPSEYASEALDSLGVVAKDKDGNYQVTDFGKDVYASYKVGKQTQKEKLKQQDEKTTIEIIETWKDDLDYVQSMLEYEIGSTEYIKPKDSGGEDLIQKLTELGVIEFTGDGDEVTFDKQECQKLIEAIKASKGDADDLAQEAFKKVDEAVHNPNTPKMFEEMATDEGIMDFEVVPKEKWPEKFYIRVDLNKVTDKPSKILLPTEAVGCVFTVDGHTYALHAHYDWEDNAMPGGMRIAELSTGLAAGPSNESPRYVFQSLLERIKSGVVKPAVEKFIKADGPASGLPDTELESVEYNAGFMDIEPESMGMSTWMSQLGWEEGSSEPEYDDDDSDSDSGGGKGSNWSGGEYDTPFEVNGITWDGSVLKALDDWAGSPEYCKTVRTAMINAVDNLPVPPRYQTKGHNGEHTAKLFDSHVHALKEKKLWRATDNEAWLDYKPGDFTPLGVASFTRVENATNISSYTSVGGSVRIEVIPASKSGKLKGISIHDLVENGPDDWVENTDNINRYKNEQEILLRCKALKIVSVDRAKRKVVAMAYVGKIPKTVVMKSKDVRPPVMHWDAMDDLSKPLSPRKKAKGKKRGRK